MRVFQNRRDPITITMGFSTQQTHRPSTSSDAGITTANSSNQLSSQLLRDKQQPPPLPPASPPPPSPPAQKQKHHHLRSLSPTLQLALDMASPKAAAAFAACGRLAKFITRPPPWLCVLALINNQVLFALMHVIASPTMGYIPPIGLALLRVAIALPFLFLLASQEGSLSKIKFRDWPYMAALGLVGVALPQTLIFVGNQLSGPNVIAIMQPAGPVYAAIFAVTLKLEKLTTYKALGTLLNVCGALVILRPDKMSFSNNASAGALIMVFQTACYAAFLIALRIKLITHPYPFGIYAHASAWGLLYIMLVGLPTGWAFFDISKVPQLAWGGVFYCGFVISFFAHAIQSWAVKNTSASFPALFSCLSPFLTGLLAFLILGETMGGASDFIGLAFNVAGLLMVVYSRYKYERTGTTPGNTPKSVPLSAAEKEEDRIRIAQVVAELEKGGDPDLHPPQEEEEEEDVVVVRHHHHHHHHHQQEQEGAKGGGDMMHAVVVVGDPSYEGGSKGRQTGGGMARSGGGVTAA